MESIGKKTAFTMAEMLIVSIIAAFIFLVIITLYFNMMNVRVDVDAKQSLVQSSYFTMEKLNVLMQDYTVDYEEYFNRKVVGCNGTQGNGFLWKPSPIANSYCPEFSKYGNGVGNRALYSCSSRGSQSTPVVVTQNSTLGDGAGCPSATSTPQSFGEYKRQFWDVGKDSDNDASNNLVGDDDDKDLGKGPVAVMNNTGVQELYLINKAGTKKLLMRRQAVGVYSGGTAMGGGDLYNLKVLKLMGFDAGTSHNFSSPSAGTYDGQIDTWACDYSQGFICNGANIGGVYTNYKLPSDNNDGWAEVFGRDLNIVDRNLQVYPNRDPKLAWNMNDVQINPYIKVYIRTQLNPDAWTTKVSADRIKNFYMDLQTTFNVKSNY